MAVYSSFVQNHVGPAGYFRDPKKISTYEKDSIYLPDVNNERNANETFKNRFSGLEKLVLVKFTNDTVIDPKDSEWFGYYDVDGKTVVNMTN